MAMAPPPRHPPASGPSRARLPRTLPVLGTVALLALSGCASRPGPAATPSTTAPGAIAELNLLTLPTALNLDGRPGPDAVAVKVFAIPHGGSRGAPLRTGTLEITAYSGTLAQAAPLPAPFHSWIFAPSDLAPQRSDTALGIGYDLVLSWSPKPLPPGRLTLLATYLAPDRPPVVSPPNHVAAAFE